MSEREKKGEKWRRNRIITIAVYLIWITSDQHYALAELVNISMMPLWFVFRHGTSDIWLKSCCLLEWLIRTAAQTKLTARQRLNVTYLFPRNALCTITSPLFTLLFTCDCQFCSSSKASEESNSSPPTPHSTPLQPKSESLRDWQHLWLLYLH